MARCPFAAWRPLPANASAPPITPRVVVFHTMVGNLKGVENYFSSGTSGGIESHFGIACPKCESAYGIKDGAIWQWMDTNKRADAQYHANGFAVSVETCDHYTGGTYTNPPLSSAQVGSWIRLGNWLAETHNIPRRRAPEWDSSGFGYHSMFGAPSNWTPAAGKTCPNPTRINQFNNVVLPAIKLGTVQGGAFMALTDAEQDELLAKTRLIHGVLFNGHVRQSIPIDALYGNAIAAVEALKELRTDLTVFGTPGLEQTQEDMAARQRLALKKLDEVLARLPEPAPVDPGPLP